MNFSIGGIKTPFKLCLRYPNDVHYTCCKLDNNTLRVDVKFDTSKKNTPSNWLDTELTTHIPNLGNIAKRNECHARILVLDCDESSTITLEHGFMFKYRCQKIAKNSLLVTTDPIEEDVPYPFGPAVLPDGTIKDHPNCTPDECATCHVVSCPIYQEFKAVPSSYEFPLPAPAILPDGTIEGHPNCKVGECDDCHVVSCAIYQGYQKAP